MWRKGVYVVDMPYTTKQAAEHSGKPLRTIQWAISQGHLPAERLGRDWIIEPADLDAWIADRSEQSA